MRELFIQIARVIFFIKGNPGMIIGLHHTAISTPNIERAKKFYCELLGFELVQEFSWQQGEIVADRILGVSNTAAQAALLKLGNSCVELFQFQSPDQPQNVFKKRPTHKHGITHICLQVDDIVSEYMRLHEAGMEFHCEPQDLETAAPCTYGRDPDGNVIELVESRDPNVFPDLRLFGQNFAC